MNLLAKMTALFATKAENGLSPMSTETTVKTELVETKSQPKPKPKKLTKKQQLENSKFLKEYSDSAVMVSDRVDFYSKKLIDFKDSGRESYITLLEKTAELTHIAIQSGNTLVEAKKELNPKEFDIVCKNYKVSKRTIDRTIELVGDSRVSKLTLNQLKSIKNISKTKLLVMKDLTDTEFKLVVKGNDNYYKVLVTKNNTDKFKDTKSPYPNITDTQYKKFISEPLEFSIRELSVMKEKLKKSETTLRKVRKELSELKPKPKKSVNNTTKPTQNKKVS